MPRAIVMGVWKTTLRSHHSDHHATAVVPSSSCTRSLRVRSLRPETGHKPVMPGRTSKRRVGEPSMLDSLGTNSGVVLDDGHVALEDVDEFRGSRRYRSGAGTPQNG